MVYVKKGRMGYKKKVYSKSLSKKVSKIVDKKLDKRVEKKYFDTDKTAGVVMTQAGVMQKLTFETQGVADNQRIGDQVKLKSCTLRGFITSNTVGAVMCRIILFRWNDDDGVTPTTGDILQVTGGPQVVTSAYFFDQQRQGRFTILKDKLVYNTNAASANNYTVPIKIYKKINSRVDTRGGQTFGKGHIYLLILCSNNSLSNPGFYYYNRVSYTDQ